MFCLIGDGGGQVKKSAAVVDGSDGGDGAAGGRRLRNQSQTTRNGSDCCLSLVYYFLLSISFFLCHFSSISFFYSNDRPLRAPLSSRAALAGLSGGHSVRWPLTDLSKASAIEIKRRWLLYTRWRITIRQQKNSHIEPLFSIPFDWILMSCLFFPFSYILWYL